MIYVHTYININIYTYLPIHIYENLTVKDEEKIHGSKSIKRDAN